MKTPIALAAAAALFIPAAHAAPYTLFIYEAADQLALRAGDDAASQAYWQAYDAFGKDLAAAGVLRGGSALSVGVPVAQVAGGADTTVTAPYAQSPLSLGGYFQIDVATDAEAADWARRLPVRDGVVEIRAGYPVPGMSI